MAVLRALGLLPARALFRGTIDELRFPWFWGTDAEVCPSGGQGLLAGAGAPTSACFFQVFQGNVDYGTMQTNMFDPPITAQFIRIYPVVCRRACTLRFELIGCEMNGKRAPCAAGRWLCAGSGCRAGAVPSPGTMGLAGGFNPDGCRSGSTADASPHQADPVVTAGDVGQGVPPSYPSSSLLGQRALVFLRLSRDAWKSPRELFGSAGC